MRDLIVSTAAACARPPRFVFGVARHRREQVVETLDALIAHARQGWVVTRLPRRTIDDLTQLWRAARRRVRPEVTR